jgi:hypothetical protein
MKANFYKILDDCVERGIAYGYERAHKHSDSPLGETIKDTIHQAVMNEICEYFNFEELRGD